MVNRPLKLTYAQRKMAADHWTNGYGTDYIAWALDVAECRVYNSLTAIRALAT